jgi:Asp-tRNA(Asn)/Glu-tRNA(Gln) amidotransferase A subunit family amidase
MLALNIQQSACATVRLQRQCQPRQIPPRQTPPRQYPPRQYPPRRFLLGLVLNLLAVSLWAAPAPPAESSAPDFLAAEPDILQLQLAMGAGRITSRQLVEFYLARIERLNASGVALNVVREVNPDAVDRAEALDAERRAKGPRSPLHGLPILIKDNFQTEGMSTTAGSKLFSGFQPSGDAYQVTRLRAAGAIILGKTNMHEFGFGITGQGSSFGRARNPYALERNPGDGAAAAVAANLAVAALGTDSCGGLRTAAAHNSLVTLRGTQGLSSRSGIVPLSHTQDMAGPLARSVSDLALLLDATVGFDPADQQSALSLQKIPSSYTRSLDLLALQGARIGVLEDLLLVDPEDSQVVGVFGAALAELQAAGAELERIKAPELVALMDSRVNGFFVLAHDFRTDIAAYLQGQPLPGIVSLEDILARGQHDASIDASLRLAQAMDANSEADYLAELAHRRRFREVVMAIMARNELSALAYPSMRRVAAPLGAPQPGNNCRLSANTGLPAVSVPAGFTADGFPVGLELLGPSWSESSLLSLAFSYEQATRHRRGPVFDHPILEHNQQPDSLQPQENTQTP